MAAKPEYKIQKTVINYLSLFFPGALVAVSPAAGFRMSPGMAMKMVAMGYQKGTPDLLILEPRGTFFGFFLEIKAPGGSLSDDQKRYMANAARKGYAVDVAWSATEAIEKVSAYLSLPVHRAKHNT